MESLRFRFLASRFEIHSKGEHQSVALIQVIAMLIAVDQRMVAANASSKP